MRFGVGPGTMSAFAPLVEAKRPAISAVDLLPGQRASWGRSESVSRPTINQRQEPDNDGVRSYETHLANWGCLACFRGRCHRCRVTEQGCPRCLVHYGSRAKCPRTRNLLPA